MVKRKQKYALPIIALILANVIGPALRYLSSQFILHEKVRRGEVVSSLMLTLVVAIAAFVK